MILKGTVNLTACGRIDYELDIAKGQHTVWISDCMGRKGYVSRVPGRVYNVLAPYRDDHPEVLELLNWLV